MRTALDILQIIAYLAIALGFLLTARSASIAKQEGRIARLQGVARGVVAVRTTPLTTRFLARAQLQAALVVCPEHLFTAHRIASEEVGTHPNVEQALREIRDAVADVAAWRWWQSWRR